MKNTALFIFVLSLGLAGCGGNFGGSLASSGDNAAKTGTATVRIIWPSAAAQSRVIPKAADKISIVLSLAGDPTHTPVATGSIIKPATSWTSSQLRVASYTATASALLTTDSTQTPMAVGNAALNITQGGSASASITMASTVKQVQLIPANIYTSLGKTWGLSASGVDANGNVVLVAPSTITWSNSNNAVGTVNSTNPNSPVFGPSSLGSTTITATFTEVEPSAGQVPVSGTGKATVALYGPANTGASQVGGDYSGTNLAFGNHASGFSVAHPYFGQNAGTTCPPLVGEDGTVYFIHVNGIQATDANLNQKWRTSTGGLTAALGKDGHLFVADPLGGIDGYDQNGNLLWSRTNQSTYRYYDSIKLSAEGVIYAKVHKTSLYQGIDKYSPDGDYLSHIDEDVQDFCLTSTEQLWCCRADGSIVVYAYYGGKLLDEASTGTYLLNASGLVFAVKYDGNITVYRESTVTRRYTISPPPNTSIYAAAVGNPANGLNLLLLDSYNLYKVSIGGLSGGYASSFSHNLNAQLTGLIATQDDHAYLVAHSGGQFGLGNGIIRSMNVLTGASDFQVSTADSYTFVSAAPNGYVYAVSYYNFNGTNESYHYAWQ